MNADQWAALLFMLFFLFLGLYGVRQRRLRHQYMAALRKRLDELDPTARRLSGEEWCERHELLHELRELQ